MTDGSKGGNGGPPNINGFSGTGGKDDCISILSQIAKSLQNIDINVGHILQVTAVTWGYTPTSALTLVPGETTKTIEPEKESIIDKTDHKRLAQLRQEKLTKEEEEQHTREQRKAAIKKALAERKIRHEQIQLDKDAEKRAKGRIATELEMSQVVTSTPGVFGPLKDLLRSLSPTTSKVQEIMKMNRDEQIRARAERMELYGENRGRDLTDTGDKARTKRIKDLFGTRRGQSEQENELFQDVRLTKGFNREDTVDTSAILSELRGVLSGSEMFKAQTGGVLRNIIGSMTGYIGMPSLEKSRAEAEGLNQVMANVRKEVTELVQSIQAKEMSLKGMQDKGTARFTDKGVITADSSSIAKKTFADLEEQKGVLAEALAEVKMIDQIVKACGGKVHKIIKNIGFVMPELMKQNTIIQNINSGLDKNGKALKFKSRFAEVLNYALQLMARHVGQIFKNWMVQLNPLIQIKKLFNDFMGYNVKWQRTMNVIKYNLRHIVKPMMEWIAQQLVNIIGFFDIILMKIQEAFGKTPISLFDQSAADAEKMKEQLEEAQNVSAGFDELHDISGDSGGGGAENNLFGDIYKPELSEDWKNLAEKIGDLFKGIITGDMGFGEVMANVLAIAVEGVKLIAQAIWDAIKNSTIGQYIQRHWKDILAGLAAAFLAWSFLKWAGTKLAEALFGKLLSATALSGMLGKIGTAISSGLTKILGGSVIGKTVLSIGSGLLTGFKAFFSGIGFGDTLSMLIKNPKLIAEFGGWGKTLGMLFSQAFLGVVAIAFGAKGLGEAIEGASEVGSYNTALMQSGGNEEDKQSNFGNVLKGTASGAALGAGIGSFIPIIGTGVGAAIGAIAGFLTSALAPAFQEVEIAARNANNEMQRLGTYQGFVQGYSTEVSKLTELERVLKDTLDLKTQSTIEEGIQLGHTKERMVELTNAVLDGTFNTDMLTSSEQNLVGILTNLSAQQQKNAETTAKLEEAKKKLQKAELDLAIAEDVAAGNFELAAARIEYALAAEVYETDEATKKMTQLIKEASAEQAGEILRDLSPEMKENFDSYYTETDKHLDELIDLYYQYNKDEREYFLDDMTDEVQQEMRDRISAIEREVKNAPWYKRLLDIGNDGKIFGKYYIDVPSYDVGTNYVPNDGLAYLHKGEAVIPAKYNEGIGIQGKAYQEQAIVNAQLMNSISRLEATMKQGITVNGQFVQRGSDLVAVVNKTKSQTGADLLSNVSYAR